MNYSTGKLIFILIVAVILTFIAAALIVHRYRQALQRLMRTPAASVHTEAAPFAAEPLSPASAVSLADNRRAGLRLSFLLVGLSCLISSSSAILWMRLAFPDDPFQPARVAAVAFLHLWPVIPALALMWRWSRLRLIGAMVLWCVVCFLVLLWRSIEPRPLELMSAIVIEIVPAMLLVGLLLLGSATRAAAPWLLLPVTGLVWASIAGIDLLAYLVERRSPLILWFTWLGVYELMALFALVPWVLAWWPLKWLGRLLGRAYSRKLLSELMAVFATVWAIALVEKALTVASAAGGVAIVMLAPLAWIPLVMWTYARLNARSGRPSTLLVLRVFQRDAAVQRLFDDVIERWRLSGNTVMIAGTDLADRTLDAEDIFTFLDRRLGERFINSEREVAPRIAAFDMAPDMDGRYRVNECYCRDTTWQNALEALVDRSDVVLMDLRGFKAHNAGCLHELRTLAAARRRLHIVVLADQDTDRPAAEDAIGATAAGRFTWLSATPAKPLAPSEVLASLFPRPVRDAASQAMAH